MTAALAHLGRLGRGGPASGSRISSLTQVYPDFRRSAAAPVPMTAPMLNWLVGEKGIAPHIAVFDKSKRDDGTFSRSDFRYDPTSDVYHCPGGKRLGTSGTVHEGKTLLYRASKLNSDVCPLKPRCCPKEPSRKIPRDIHEHARDAARSLADTEGDMKRLADVGCTRG